MTKTRSTSLMPFEQHSATIMYDSQQTDLTAADVYDLAMDVGKEFEKLIALYTQEPVTPVMHKVLRILEYLEDYACRCDRDNTLMCELRNTISRLEAEKIEKAAERLRFDEEIQQMDDNWKDETRELLDMISRLREENRKLSSSLEEKKEVQSHVCTQEQDSKLLMKMKDSIEQTREKLRKKDKELKEAATENESLKTQLESTVHANKDLRRRHRATQQQTRLLIEEKAEMQCILQEQNRDIQKLKQNLGVVQKDKDDLAKAKNSDVDLTNKVVYDVNDPNRPRFTMDELKDILFERNDLKAKLSEIQDELDTLRPSSQQDKRDSFRDDEDDAPVQGPINKEPDDAPWKRQESGIRKLFRALLGDNTSGEGVLRKSLSRTRSVALTVLQ